MDVIFSGSVFFLADADGWDYFHVICRTRRWALAVPDQTAEAGLSAILSGDVRRTPGTVGGGCVGAMKGDVVQGFVFNM